jgi:hypothetical protein
MDATQRRVWKLKLLGIAIGIVILIPILAWKWACCSCRLGIATIRSKSEQRMPLFGNPQKQKPT